MNHCCVRLRSCGSIDFDVLFLDPMRQTAYAWRLRAGIDPADSCEGLCRQCVYCPALLLLVLASRNIEVTPFELNFSKVIGLAM